MRIDFIYKMHCLKAVRLVFIALIMMGGAPLSGWAQMKEYANSQENWRSGTGLLADVKQPEKAADGDESTNAELISRLINILGIQTSGESWVQMNFQTPVPLNATTYVKIDAPTTTGGLNLDLLSILGGLLGILESDLLNVEVYNGSTALNPTEFKANVVEDSNGQSYVAITSTENYTGIRVRLKYVGNLLGVSLGSGINLNVYEAFYYTDAPDCGRPLYTYYEDSGLNIGLLEFQNRNLNNAIDSDEDTYSQLKQGALLGVNVAGSQSQVFNFASSSSEEASLNVLLSIASNGVLNTDLLGSSEVILYNNNEVVYQRSIVSSLLNNTNLLDLLDNGDPVKLTFAPGRSFDRAEVRLTSPVGLSLLGSAVRIHDIQRYDDAAGCKNPEIADLPDSTDDPFDEASCSSDLIDFDNVDFAQRAVDGNNETYATLHADAGGLLVSGPTAGFIEMDLGQNVPANKTTYVRINYDEDVLDRLLGGSLGKLVGDLANDLLLGNQYFEVEAKNGTTSVLTSSSSNAFEGTSNGAVTLVQDNIGRYYIAITPDATYNRIRITNRVVALLPTGKKGSLDVYNACFEIGTDTCSPANFTSYRGGGIGLNAGNISNVGVTNAYRAISENSSEYSEINLGVAGLVANVYQTIYFSQPSQTNDKVKIRVALEPSSALALDVLGRYQVRFFNGATQVGNDETLESGLINNLDLVALFGSGGIVELEYEPNGIFDRVEIGAASIASVNVATEPLRLYSVERYGDTCPLVKTAFPFEEPSCSTTLIASKNADDVQNLFDDDFDSYATLKSGAGFLLGLGDKYEGYVEMGYDQPVDAGVTSYIRIDFEETILEGLVGGSLGNVVSGLLNGLVLGNHFFTVEVKDASANILHSASSNQASAGGDDAIRVVQDAAGRYYIAVTPTADYQSVRITDGTNSVLGLLAEPNTMNVYGMCTDLVEDPCFGPFATSYEHEGLSLSVNDLGGAGVTNGSYAINDNTTNYSEINNGTLGVGASTKQWIFFNSVSNEQDIATLKFKTAGGVVDADILGGLEIKAYLGNNEVYNVTSQNGIINGVNVAQLLTNGQMVDLDIAPGQKFDRISIGIKTLAEVAIFPPIHLYEVGRICEDDQTITMPDCIQGCNDNTFWNSHDPNTIEYDNMVSSFHSTMLKESDGTVKVWGEKSAGSGSGTSVHVLSPIAVTPANGYNYTGEILKFTIGSLNISQAQFAVLTTDGLYVWGDPGRLVNTAVKPSSEFGKVSTAAAGTNNFGLPTGVNPQDVKMMFGSYKTLGIVTCSGAAWMLSDEGAKNGDGTTTNGGATWTRVQTAANVPLTNVVAMRGTRNAMMALTSNGDLYTWGMGTYLGNGTARDDTRSFATKMTLPHGVTPKMIGMTNLPRHHGPINSYYLLATNGALYALGDNSRKQLGDYTITERTAWVRVKSTATTDMSNITWISPNEHDGFGFTAVNALTTTGELWSWGYNDGNMLGAGDGDGDDKSIDPTSMIGGLDPSDLIMAVETGGHTTMVIRQCSKKYGYIGHRVNGSMGDGIRDNGNETTFNFTNTAEVNLCGAPAAPTAPTVQDIEICPGETADLNTAHIGSTPLGSTLEWWTTPTREPGTQVTTNLDQVPIGTYYAFHQGFCPDPPASKAVHVRLKTDIEITIEVDNETPMIGHEVEFTIRAANTGESDAGNAVVTAVLPDGYEFVSADAGYDPVTHLWTVGSLTAGEVKILKIRARVKADGNYTYSAFGSSEKEECDLTNNNASITVSPKPNLLITNPMIHQRMK